MKERVALARNVKVEDSEAAAFRPNYAYYHEDGLQYFFEPTFIPPLRLVYPGPAALPSGAVIVMPAALATRFRQVHADMMALVKDRMENPFVPPAPPAPEDPPGRTVTPGPQGGGN